MKPGLPSFLLAVLLPILGAVATDAAPALPAEHRKDAEEAREYFDQGNYADAAKVYEQILATSPDNVYALSNLGVCRFREGELALAEQAFLKSIAIAPTDEFSYFNLGFVYGSMKRLDDAIKALQRAVEINPQNAMAHIYLGIVYMEKGRTIEALTEFEMAGKLDRERGAKTEKLPAEIPARFRTNES